jgi:hypothetical protein
LWVDDGKVKFEREPRFNMNMGTIEDFFFFYSTMKCIFRSLYAEFVDFIIVGVIFFIIRMINFSFNLEF